jgi:hypothetical protein
MTRANVGRASDNGYPYHLICFKKYSIAAGMGRDTKVLPALHKTKATQVSVEIP